MRKVNADRMNPGHMTLLIIILFGLVCCSENKNDEADPAPGPAGENGKFYFGADLSYVNQILDHNGVYKDEGETRDPYRIFRDHGANLVRLRLWHDPRWTKEVYDPDGDRLYNDYRDVERAIARAKENDMVVLLDLHYSDSWADPGKQEIPEAWKEITDIEVLRDSVYDYTKKVLFSLDSKGLMPEFVQLGNEINCGMMHTGAAADFPKCNACDGHWKNLGEVINSGIAAVREVSGMSSVKTNVILHVADPIHVQWWFDNIVNNGKVTDFDVIGFSYYPIWHTGVQVGQLSSTVEQFRTRYKKQVMILETAYPWTTDGADSYNNIFGGQAPLPGYPFTSQGQLDIMKALTLAMKKGGGCGIVYWEPAWITSDMKDLWGTGSAWENCTFFDFEGYTLEGMNFMNANYE